MMINPLGSNTISQPPSLYAEKVAPFKEQHPSGRTLVELLHDGFYLLLLLKNSHLPDDAERFAGQVRTLLENFERNARRLDMPGEDILASKYAFCATIDEIILTSDMAIRERWERAPLQLLLFGDQLAGEIFYSKLEEVRHRGNASVQALEVFYMCLLIGFQGKYALDGPEKLDYLIAALDKEITHMKGKRALFAPYWKAPDHLRNLLKAETPMWFIATGCAVLGSLAYIVLSWLLAQHTNSTLGNYFDIIKLAPKIAHITITLP